MKFYSLIVCIFLLSVDAQRRSVKSELLENEPASRSVRRGRGRFTITSEPTDVEEPKISQPLSSRRLPSRRRPDVHAESRKAYEVDEVVDDIPPEPYRRFKTKVATENKFEVQNAPPSYTLFQPETTENLEEVIKSIDGEITDATSSPIPSSSTVSSDVEPSSPELSEDSKNDNEISKSAPESTTPISARNAPRSNTRSRTNNPTIASRLRGRGRSFERTEEEPSQPAKPVSRGSRRRPDPNAVGETRTRAPSSSAESIPPRSRFEARTRAPAPASAETVEVPIRSRFEARTRAPVATSTETVEASTRARFETRTRASTISSAESVELPTRSRFAARTRAPPAAEQPRRVRVETRTRGPSVIASVENSELPSRSRSGRKIGTASRRSDEVKPVESTHSRRSNARENVEATSIRSRSRLRVQETPPVIDEQKLEVLPLFEREAKTVKPVMRKVVARRRNLNSADEVEMSATEDDVKVVQRATKESVVVETRTEATIRRRKVTSKLGSRTTRATTTSTEATGRSTKPIARSTKPTVKVTKPTVKSTKPTVKSTKPTRVQTSKPVIKESVISEVSEVTSKRTITRNKGLKIVSVKPFSRASKKPEVNSTSPRKSKSGLTSSEEEIEDSDNYPEHFKALIQAKKQKNESRSSQHRLTTASPAVTKTTEKVVISSPSTTTQVISSEANRQREDSENELDPPKVKPTRRRFSPGTEKAARPTRKNKFTRSTAAPPVPTTERRFHAKFNTDTEATSSNPVKSRSFSAKPPRGLYSSRKTKESLTKNKSTTQIPIPKKSNRYSSRYRNDASTRGAIRTSTNAPAYLPTIPTITPPTTSVKSPLSYQDKDLGVEVISFDDPVNTVPSANLVSGEYLASSTENDITSPLVSASQTKTTEKPVSIIERIINSISAISTTEVPDVSKLTTSSSDKLPTKESAILKLATKKSTRLDKIQTTQKIPTVTVTSEKPTTIIERILSSLSAIQANNTTATKNSKSKQVGSNFNTISSPSTTPITRVTKSALYAQLGTSVSPLLELDDIPDEQILQKRTIDKLLVLLNTLTSPHPPQPTPLVVVTPKTTSYVVGSSPTATTVPTTTISTTTTTSTTTPTSSTTTESATTTTSTTESSLATNELFTSPIPSVTINSRSLPAVRYTTTPTTTILTTQAPSTTTSVVTTTTQIPIITSTETVTTSQVPTTPPTVTTTATAISAAPTTTVATTDISNEIGALPLSLESGVTSSSSVTEIPSSTDSSSMSTESTSSTEFSTVSSTEFAVDTETNFSFPSTVPFPSTLPSVINFEVSPGSVSVFNANDLSNAITQDYPSTTVTISARANFPDNVVSTDSTTSTPTTTISSPTSDNSTTQNSVTVQTSTSNVMTENSTGTTTSSPSTTSDTVTGTTTSFSNIITTEVPSMTTTDSAASSNMTTDSTGSSNTSTDSVGSTSTSTDSTSSSSTSTESTGSSSTSTESTGSSSTSTVSTGSSSTSTDSVGSSSTSTESTGSSSTSTESTGSSSTSTESTGSSSTSTDSTGSRSTSTDSTGSRSTSTDSTGSSSTSTDSSGSSNTTQDISSNIIDTTDLPEKSNQTQTSTVNRTNVTSRASGRSGRLLSLDPDPVPNSLESSTLRPKDYFIFAVLNNNTVLRKRPSRFPTKDTPYLIVGVYPNNTIIRRFPNGTLVPMEPVIRVSGFDTRENPPLISEITSNQVTPDQGSRPDNKNLQTVDPNTEPQFEANPLFLSTVNNATSTTEKVSSSTASSVQANPLSLSSSSSTTTETSTSTSTSSSSSSSSTASTPASTTPSTTTSSTAPTATLPTLTEILNGRTVQAFNSIINISNLSKTQTLQVDPKTKIVTTTLPTPTLSNRILDDIVSSTMSLTTTTTQQPTTTTTQQPTTTTTQQPTTITTQQPTTTMLPTTTMPPKPVTTTVPTTTPVPTTTVPPSTTATLISSSGTTVLPLSQPATTTFRTTTFLPQFLTTFFSTLRPRKDSTEPPLMIVTPSANNVPTTTPRVEISTGGDLVTAASTRRTISTTTEPGTTILSTLPASTTQASRGRTTTMTTTTPQPTTTILTTTLASSTSARNARSSTESPTATTDGAKRLRQLTDQQKKDLQTLAQLEQEQAAILKQLAFLTNLNFAAKTTTDKNDLANRVIALAIDRDKERQTTTLPPTTTVENKRKGKKISTSSEQSIEELVKQLNIVTPSTLTTDYGKSNDAIIAALLKEQGIGPTTPKSLEDIYKQTTTTTRKPRTTTRRSGPLMQSLNWLLNALSPPTTRRPKPKPKSKKPKPKPTESQEEILTHEPTNITPVVTPAPSQNVGNSLSDSDIQKLIQQLQQIQKDPENSKGLDFSSIQSLQSLLEVEEGVKVTSIGTTGTTTRETTPATATATVTVRETTTTSSRKGKSRVIKSTTVAPVSVSNNIDEEELSTTTTRTRATLPPVRLRPVPGVDNDGTLVRGQLINAAVNVTRAISSFLGTALQGAATSFQSILGSGSRVVGSLMQVSSNTSSRPG